MKKKIYIKKITKPMLFLINLNWGLILYINATNEFV